MWQMHGCFHHGLWISRCGSAWQTSVCYGQEPFITFYWRLQTLVCYQGGMQKTESSGRQRHEFIGNLSGLQPSHCFLSSNLCRGDLPKGRGRKTSNPMHIISMHIPYTFLSATPTVLQALEGCVRLLLNTVPLKKNKKIELYLMG